MKVATSSCFEVLSASRFAFAEAVRSLLNPARPVPDLPEGSMRSCHQVALLAGLGALLACEPRERPAATPPLTLERVPMPGNLKLPFSAAVRVGPMLYLSGQLGTDSTGRLVAGGIGPETAQALANVRALLAAHGSGMDRVVRCTAMLADMAEWPAMNEEYARHFPAGFPARSAFGATGLALGARVELECTALADGA
jgi:2-iminobutanoate/2-iminopropanoate deaminase